MISSKRLLEGCIEKFDMLQEDKRSFEEDIRELVLYFCQLKQVSFERRKETSIDFDVLFLEQVSRLLPHLLQKSKKYIIFMCSCLMYASDCFFSSNI